MPNIRGNLHMSSAFGTEHLKQGEKAVDSTSWLVLVLNAKLRRENVTRECERVTLEGSVGYMEKIKCFCNAIGRSVTHTCFILLDMSGKSHEIVRHIITQEPKIKSTVIECLVRL